jgi:hypothetical protein
VVLEYFRSRSDTDPEIGDIVDSDEMVEFADELLNAEPSHNFIFKGMENDKKVSRKLIDNADTYILATTSQSELVLTSTLSL